MDDPKKPFVSIPCGPYCKTCEDLYLEDPVFSDSQSRGYCGPSCEEIYEIEHAPQAVPMKFLAEIDEPECRMLCPCGTEFVANPCGEENCHWSIERQTLVPQCPSCRCINGSMTV